MRTITIVVHVEDGDLATANRVEQFAIDLEGNGAVNVDLHTETTDEDEEAEIRAFLKEQAETA